MTVALVRRSRRGPADSELTCDTAHSARGKDRGHDRVRALRPDLRTARVMGRAMPSSVARTSSDLLTKLLARIIDELDYIREVARRKTWRPRSPRRIPDPTRSTPQRLASAGCMPPARRANHRMVAIRGPWIESIGETHEGQGNRHEEGAPPSPHRRDGPCGGDFWIFGEHLGSNAPAVAADYAVARGLAEGQAFGTWLCSKASACGRGSGATGGCTPTPSGPTRGGGAQISEGR